MFYLRILILVLLLFFLCHILGIFILRIQCQLNFRKIGIFFCFEIDTQPIGMVPGRIECYD